MRSYKDLMVSENQAFVRVEDLFTHEVLGLPLTSLSGLNISRTSSGGATASIRLINDGCKFYAPGVQTTKFTIKDNGQDKVVNYKRSGLWDAMALTRDKGSRNPLDEKFYLKQRPYLNSLSDGYGRSFTDTREADFFRFIFSGDAVVRELNADRAALYQEIMQKSGPVDTALLAEYFALNSLVSLRARVDIDLVDYRGYVWTAFTGFISRIRDRMVAGEVPTMELSCKDGVELWRQSMVVMSKALSPTSDSNLEAVQAADMTAVDQVFVNTLVDKDCAGIFEELVGLVDGAFSLQGFMSLSQNAGFEVVRDPSNPMFYTTKSPVLLKTTPQKSITPKFVRNDRLWFGDEASNRVSQPYIGSNIMGLAGETQLRGPGLALYDANFSRKYRACAPYVMQKVLKSVWQLFYSTVATPYDVMSGTIQPRTFADFYCSGNGDIIFKLPYFNHMPGRESPWEDGDLVMDCGFHDLQPPDTFHGSEYVLTSFGLEERDIEDSDEGKFTRSRVAGNMAYMPRQMAEVMQKYVYGGVQTMPSEFQGIFGVREYSGQQSFTNLTSKSLEWFASAVLCMLNWKTSKLTATYSKVMPWEPGKNVYLPDRDMLFYLEGVSYNWQKGSKFSCTLNGAFGHPSRTILPIPWMYLHDGKRGETDYKAAMKDVFLPSKAFSIKTGASPQDIQTYSVSVSAYSSIGTIVNRKPNSAVGSPGVVSVPTTPVALASVGDSSLNDVNLRFRDHRLWAYLVAQGILKIWDGVLANDAMENKNWYLQENDVDVLNSLSKMQGDLSVRIQSAASLVTAARVQSSGVSLSAAQRNVDQVGSTQGKGRVTKVGESTWLKDEIKKSNEDEGTPAASETNF